MLAVPLRATGPLAAPLALQLVALVEDQVNVEEPPLAMLAGDAVTVAVGGVALIVTVTDRFALPPMPEQVRV